MAKQKFSKRLINGCEYYYKKVTIGHDPITKKAIRKEFYGKKTSEVTNKINEFLALSNQNLNPDSKDSFGELFEYWLNNVKFISGVKNSTKERYWGLYINYINNIESFLVSSKIKSIDINKLLIRNIPLIKLDISNIQEYYNTLHMIGISSNTISSINKLIKPFIRYAYSYNKIIKDFASGLVIPNTVNVKANNINNSIEIFSIDEQNTFLNSILDDREEALYHVALSMGLRLGELLGLKWSCIDFDKQTLTVEYSARREKDIISGVSQLVITTLKTQTSYATLPIPDCLIPKLMKHKESQDNEKNLASNLYTDNDLVFCTELGKIIEPTNLRKRYKKILVKNNISYKKFHTLRHTCASRLFESGLSVAEVKTLLRHKNLATTVDIYIHFTKEHKKKLINKIIL